MLLPISHDSMEARRLPWVTIALVLINFLAFAATLRATDVQVARINAAAGTAVAYFREHPYLEAHAPLDRVLAQVGISRAVDPGDGDVDEEQAELDGLNDVLAAAVDGMPVRRFGYIPASPSAVTIFTSQFMHGGWLHLLFNIWFLWLAGSTLEDAWGRVWFPVFYLLAGAFAALSHQMMAPGGTAPLIGASGAIAGAMGAFLVKFSRTKIRFMWLWIRASYFSAPAYLMLPLWLALQLYSGAQDNGGDGVAYWAHVGGFAFGVVVAGVLRVSGVDRKIDEAIVRRVEVGEDPRVQAAAALIDAGRAREAIAALDGIRREGPAGVQISVELERLRAATLLSDRALEGKSHARLIELYLHEGVIDAALELFDAMMRLGIDDALPPSVRLRVAQKLERTAARHDLAARQYALIHRGSASDETSFQALLSHALLMVRRKQKEEALGLLMAAQSAPYPHLEWEAKLDAAFNEAMALRDMDLSL